MDEQKNSQFDLSDEKIKTILESILFVNERPVDVSELVQIMGFEKKKIEKTLDILSSEYAARAAGICVVKVAGGYQMCSSPENEPWIKKMFRQRSRQKLSVAALETLAIIAYKQPITRMEIESIRGVSADGVTKNLLNSGLIKTAGRKEVPGRPFLHITTRKFLEYFGLNSLKDLPQLEEFVNLAEKDKVMGEIIHSESQNNPVDKTEKANSEVNDNAAID